MQNARLRTLIRFTPSIVIMLVIFYFSNQPAAISNSQSEFFSGNLNISWLSDHQLFVAVRKAAHALIYACLGLTLLLGFGTSKIAQNGLYPWLYFMQLVMNFIKL